MISTKIQSNEISAKAVQKATNIKKSKCKTTKCNILETIISDSQGRDLASYLDKLVGEYVAVFGHIQPEAPLDILMSSASAVF